MEKNKVQTIIDYFDIPVELAKRLSEVMCVRNIRMQLLQTIIGTPQYETVEKSLIPLEQEFEAIKLRITKEFVPDKYKSSPEYIWNYSGWYVTENRAEIIQETM